MVLGALGERREGKICFESLASLSTSYPWNWVITDVNLRMSKPMKTFHKNLS